MYNNFATAFPHVEDGKLNPDPLVAVRADSITVS